MLWCQDLALAIAKQSVAFNDLNNFWRNQFFPGVISGPDFGQDVATANSQ